MRPQLTSTKFYMVIKLDKRKFFSGLTTYANTNCTNVLLLSAVFLILIISKIVFIVTLL